MLFLGSAATRSPTHRTVERQIRMYAEGSTSTWTVSLENRPKLNFHGGSDAIVEKYILILQSMQYEYV